MIAAAPAWRVHDLAPGLSLRVVRKMPALTTALEAEVERLWAAAQARSGGALFNGRVFSADTIAPALIEGHWTEYRRVIARIARPDLAPELAAAPVAAGGIIVGDADADRFVLFGRRPADAVYQAGEWQLPPAGSLDPGAADGDVVDPVRQLLAEMAEELGLPAEAVTEPRPLCLVEHPDSGVLDLGILVRTTWGVAAILAAHVRAPDREYDQLEAVFLRDLPAFLARHEGRVTRQAFFFMERAGLMRS